MRRLTSVVGGLTIAAGFALLLTIDTKPVGATHYYVLQNTLTDVLGGTAFNTEGDADCSAVGDAGAEMYCMKWEANNVVATSSLVELDNEDVTCSPTTATNWTWWSPEANPPNVSSEKSVIDSACIQFDTQTVPAGTDIDVELSNDGGQTGVFVEDAISSANCPSNHTADCYCAHFPIRDRRFRWRARLCPDGAGTGPSIAAASHVLLYREPEWSVMSGVTVAGGLKYIASNYQPGNEGRLWAYVIVAGGTDTVGWVVADGLDPSGVAAGDIIALPADGSRKIFTLVDTSSSCSAGGSGKELMEFTVANASDAKMQRLLGTCGESDPTDVAEKLVNWVRCGVYEAGTASSCNGRFTSDEGTTMSRLGGFYRSTPAVLEPPKIPYWREITATADATEITAINSYISNLSSRGTLVLAGARDGMLHAFYSPADQGDSNVGREAWAFIPPEVASAFKQQYSDNGGTDEWEQDTWPDGPPRLYPYWDVSEGTYRTALVQGTGYGGRDYYALDVTETIDSSGVYTTSGCSHGGTCGLGLLWYHSDSNSGMALSQAALRRDEDNPAVHPPVFHFVFGSGPPPLQAGK